MYSVPAWVSRYVGAPYLKCGRGIGGLDCWGLVRLVFHERYNISLPIHAATTDIKSALHRAMQSGKWKQTEEPNAMDVVVMVTPTGYGDAAPLHVGIMVSQQRVLHVDEDHESVCVALKHPSIASRLHSIWRYCQN